MQKRKLIGFSLIVYLLIVGIMVVTAQETENEIPQFLRETQRYLREAGWSETDLQRLQERLEEHNWDEIDSADPEVVAMALQLANRNRQQLEASENADLAFQLARMSQSMLQLGFDRREIARASFEGTREAVRSIKQVRKNAEETPTENKDELQEQIREQIKNLINT